MKVVIRTIQPADEDQVRDLFVKGKAEDASYSAHTLALTRYFAQSKTAPGADMSHICQHYLQQAVEHPLRHFWVAVDEDSGELLGCIGAEESTFEPPSLAPVEVTAASVESAAGPVYQSTGKTTYTYIHQPSAAILMSEGGSKTACIELVRLTVQEKCQGRGIGRKLLQAVEEHGKSQDCQFVYLTTLKEMHAAYAFYQRLNFDVALREVVNTSVIPHFQHGDEAPFDFEVVHFLRAIP